MMAVEAGAGWVAAEKMEQAQGLSAPGLRYESYRRASSPFFGAAPSGQCRAFTSMQAGRASWLRVSAVACERIT